MRIEVEGVILKVLTGKPKVAINRRNDIWESTAIKQPSPYRWLTLTFLLLFIFAVPLLFLGDYNRKETVTGYLAPVNGVAKLFSPGYFYVDKVLVSEGDIVVQDQPLIILKPFSESGETAESSEYIELEIEEQLVTLKALKDATLQVNQDTRLKLQLEYQKTQEQISYFDRKIEVLANRLDTVKQNLTKYEALNNQGFTSLEHLSQHRDKLLTLQKALLDDRSEQNMLNSQLSAVELELNSLDSSLTLQLSELDLQLSELRKSLIEVRRNKRVAIRASMPGIISFTEATVGQVVTPNQLLVSVLPEDQSLQVELIVPTRAYGFITSGKEVVIKYDAFPYQKFGSYKAYTTTISTSVILPNEVKLPINFTEPSYRVSAELVNQKVSAYNANIPLRPGMQVSAEILLENRSLIEWLLDPILSL
ncbi:HlyD family efflux transporter periplasmic adaptor subunit [Vibrio jasicida]|uniref:HlyD family efflux transporter periplasmic adaptor subunit n=1 Tax=Vibrio jasicida TaxID=766224 RepID=UPI0015E29E91|nr:HlyD family efflux transporter periplasmic adaptor subunit [Vibrio jasicida]